MSAQRDREGLMGLTKDTVFPLIRWFVGKTLKLRTFEALGLSCLKVNGSQYEA